MPICRQTYGTGVDLALGAIESAARDRIAATILPILTTDLPPLSSQKVEAGLARASKKDQAKQELAARLGVAVEDILPREEVGPMMDPPRTTSWMEKNRDACPPFFSKGDRQKAYYPRQWVDQFLATGKVKDASGAPLKERQPWPPAPPAPPPVDEGKRQRARDLLDDVHAIAQPSGTSKDEDHWRSVSEGL